MVATKIRARDLTPGHIGRSFRYRLRSWGERVEGEGQLTHLGASQDQGRTLVAVELENEDGDAALCLDPNDTLTVL